MINLYCKFLLTLACFLTPFLKKSESNITIITTVAKSLLALLLFMALLAPIAAIAQNTKGDKPVPSRENRFRTPFKGKNQKKQKVVTTQKRVPSKEKSVAGRANTSSTPRSRPSGNDRPGRPISPIVKSQPATKERAWRGDIAGYRIRAKSSPGKSRNIYPQYGRYVHNPSRKPKPTEKAVSNSRVLSSLRQLQSPESGSPPKRRKVVPRSASGSFTARKSINVYANFARPKRKGEQAVTKDIAGRPLRRKNFETSRPGVIAPTFKPYQGRKTMGDKPAKSISGGYRTATRPSEQAWQGDVAKRRIRSGRVKSGDRPFQGASGGFKSITAPGETRTGKSPLPPRVPGVGADRIGKFQGNIKGGRPAKGGGSISGGTWNNNGQAVEVRTPQQGIRAARFQGNIKASRPAKGGGSVSGQVWNNYGHPLAVRTPQQGIRAARFQGNVKTSRPAKGGGSISGKGWNNDGRAIAVRTPQQGIRAARFQGNIKTSRPAKGGGSVSGQVWNNDGKAIAVRTPQQGIRAARFQGNIKASRPVKGGESISGKLWNNKEHAIVGTIPASSAYKVDGYPGKMKRFEVQPGFGDQGETFTGFIKRKDFNRDYVQNPYASKESIRKKEPKKSAFNAKGLIVKTKRPDYVENPNSADEALRKLRPSSSTYQAGELQVRVKQQEYGKKPHGAEGALYGIKPSAATVRASEYDRGIRRTWDYVHNPSSADEAMKTREPGKAFARQTAYQGNIKMQKFSFFERNQSLHPDTKFIKTNKNNVDEERDALTNFKLWWARMFKKQETQPENLKYVGKKPRYDKGEAGLWYE